jgi:hypothetical protein
MQSVLQKIDRIAKPIKKNTQVVTESLIKKNIFLEQENFDILQLLQQRQVQPSKKDRRQENKKEAAEENEKYGSRKNQNKRVKLNREEESYEPL